MSSEKNVNSVAPRIVVLIIDAPMGLDERWDRERKAWLERPIPKGVSAYLVRAGKEGIIRESGARVGVISGRGSDSKKPGIFNKTISALRQVINSAEFIVRTNLSTFLHFGKIAAYVRGLRAEDHLYAGGYIRESPQRKTRRLSRRASDQVGQKNKLTRVDGWGIVLSRSTATLLLSHTTKFERRNIPDDDLIGCLIRKNSSTSPKLSPGLFIRCKWNTERLIKLTKKSVKIEKKRSQKTEVATIGTTQPRARDPTLTKQSNRDVIYGLCAPREIRKWLIRRNRLARKNVGPMDMIIFHLKGEYPDSLKKSLTKPSWAGRILFVDVSHDWDFSKEPYRNMCAFYSWHVWKYLKAYDMALRLDDDSLVTTKVNPFKCVRDSGGVYGYVRRKVDNHKATLRTLPNIVRKHHSIPSDLFCVQNFYNNFCVTKVNFWFRPEVQAFLSMIREEGGVYKHRWGDSNIQAIAVKLFLSDEKIIEIKCGYIHGSHNYNNRGGKLIRHEW